MYEGKIKLDGQTEKGFYCVVNDNTEDKGQSFYEEIRNHDHAKTLVAHWNTTPELLEACKNLINDAKEVQSGGKSTIAYKVRPVFINELTQAIAEAQKKHAD